MKNNNPKQEVLRKNKKIEKLTNTEKGNSKEKGLKAFPARDTRFVPIHTNTNQTSSANIHQQYLHVIQIAKYIADHQCSIHTRKELRSTPRGKAKIMLGRDSMTATRKY